MGRGIPIQPPVVPAADEQQSTISSTNHSQSVTQNQISKRIGLKTNKAVIGVVAAIIAIGALVLIAGQRNSAGPTVAPDDQQSGYRSFDDYSSEFRSSFMDGCLTEGDYESCVCLLETLEERYTVEEVARLGESGDTSFYNPIIKICS